MKHQQVIDMRSRRFGYFPLTFVWRRREYHVEEVMRCWTTASKSSGKIDRHYFDVRCAEGMYSIYQDLQHNTWYIDA